MSAANITLTGWKLGQKRRGAADTMNAAQAAESERLARFEALASQHWERLHRYAVRLCSGKNDDAEDLLADSLIEAFRIFDRFRGDGFDRWLFRIMTTNRIDMARRAKVRYAESLDARLAGDGDGITREIADTDAGPEARLLRQTYSEAVQAALDALPEEFRAVILLCDVEQMEYQEIAQTLQIPVGTVRSRISRGRAQMRKTLEKWGVRG